MMNGRAQFRNQPKRGVALVAVLSVLVVLALLAASFAVLISIEMNMATASSDRVRLDLLLQSGLSHAQAALVARKMGAGSVSPGLSVPVTTDSTAGPWITVNDSSGMAIGRYRVRIEDEGAKVNLLAPHLTTPSKGSGWDMSEINLVQALDIPESAAKQIRDWQLGENGVPGAIGDDDRNNDLLMADGIDNNANGVVDEDNEGVEDPREYNPVWPRGDDRAFASISDVRAILMGTGKQPDATLAVRRGMARGEIRPY